MGSKDLKLNFKYICGGEPTAPFRPPHFDYNFH